MPKPEKAAPMSAVMPEPSVITGREPADGSGQVAALTDFYRAFNGRDLAAMRSNWAVLDEIAMDNPLGGIKRGWAEIGAVYQRLFSGPARVYVEFHDYTLQTTPDMFCAIGRERGRFERDGERIDLAIRTSRVFRRIAGAWRQTHHHGSIDDPALLTRYQRAVLGP